MIQERTEVAVNIYDDAALSLDGGYDSGSGGRSSSGSTGGGGRRTTTTTTSGRSTGGTTTTTRRSSGGSTTITGSTSRSSGTTSGTSATRPAATNNQATVVESVEDKKDLLTGALEKNVEADEFFNNPATPLDYSKDMFSVYINSAIKLHKYEKKDGESVGTSSYITSISKDNATEINQYIKLLQQAFKIDYYQANSLITNYLDVNINVDNNKERFISINKAFLNNVESTFNFDNSDTYTKDNYHIEIKPYKDDSQLFICTIAEPSETNNLNECNNISFLISFYRTYLFNPFKIDVDKYTQLNNANYQIKFNIKQLPKDYGLNIKYSDIKYYLWFSVDSYLSINDIQASIEYYDDEKRIKNKIIRLYPDQNNSEKSNDEYNANYSLKYGNKTILNTDNINVINSDYYTEFKEIEHTKNYVFKYYFSKGFIQAFDNDESDDLVDVDKIKLIDIFVTFDNSEVIDGGEAITNAPAFRVYANTHSYVDYINKGVILYGKYNPKNSDEELIARYKLKPGESNFYGNISVFYGNQIVYPGNKDILENNEIRIIGGKNDKSLKFYYQILKKDDYINVYFKVNGNEDFIIKKFITVTLSDTYAYESIEDTETASLISGTISQNEKVIHNIDINIPQVAYGDSIVFIDNSANNKTKHYTYYTKLSNGKNSYSYYGIRAIGYYNWDNATDTLKTYYYDNGFYDVGISGLSYNVNAKIVKLIPTEEKETIYSFTNGEQLVYLKQPAALTIKDNKLQGGELAEILPNYKFSYEYIVKNEIPSTNKDKYYNFKFYPGYVTKDYIPATNVDFDNYNNYQIHIPYTIVNKDNSGTYTKISNLESNYPIYENMDNSIDNNLYEYDYIPYSEINKQLTLDNGVYDKVEEFVKINPSTITLNTFKNVVLYNESTEHDTDKYYKYSLISKEYSKYTYDEVKDLEYLPLNIYVKYVYYLKRAKYTEEELRNSYMLNRDRSNQIPVNANNINSILNSKDMYVQRYGSITLPFKGFVKDGSMEYYGYLNIKLSDVDLFDQENIKTNNSYFALQEYSYVSINDEETFNNYRFKKVDLYTQHNIFNFIPIPSDYTIYNLDVSGNTIYASGNEKEDIIDIDLIRQKYYEITDDVWASAANRDNIERDEDSDYWVKNFPLSNDNSLRIRYTVTLEGNYDKVVYTTDKFDKFKDNHTDFYIKKENSLVNIDDIISGDIYSTWWQNLLKYNVKDKIYFSVLSKLTAKDLSDEYLSNPRNNIYYFINGEYYNVNKETGKIDNFTVHKINQKFKISYDIHSCIHKEYFEKDKKISESHIAIVEPGPKNTVSNQIHFGDKYVQIERNTQIPDDKDIYNSSHQVVSKDTALNNLHAKFYYDDDFGNRIKLTLDRLNYFITYESDKTVFQLLDGDFIPKTLNDAKSVFDTKYFYKTNEWVVNWQNLIGKNVNENPKEIDANTCPYVIFDSSKVAFYEKGIKEYSYYTGGQQGAFQTLEDLESWYDSANAHLDYYSYEDSTYTFDIYYKTNFLYKDFTISDDISIDTDGSYFINVMVFDSVVGKKQKKLYLNNHVRNITRYTYEYNVDSYLEVDSKYDLTTVSSYEYNKFYINIDGEYTSLSQFGNSPQYYKNIGYSLFTKYTEISYNIYNTLYDSKQLGYPDFGVRGGTKITNEPVVIKKNDTLYGLIFNNDINEKQSSSTISFDTNFDTNYNQSNILDIGTTEIRTFNEGDNKVNGTINELIPNIEQALEAANNELYYNNYKDDCDLELYNVDFIPSYFLYDIVELSSFTFRNYNSSRNLLQSRGIISNPISVNEAFSLSNEENIEFTGGYTWIAPKYRNVIDENGNNTIIIAQDGYWEKKYEKVKKPLIISSYNFYDKNSISAVNISYSFIPYSYVITAEIEHPAISYDTIINEMIEEYKFSYVLNGFEYDYDNNSPISYENGLYYGTIKIEDINNDTVDAKVILYKRNLLSSRASIKNVKYQDNYVSYSYFAYLTATPLTNEKIPVLYNTELIPPKLTNIQYWNERTNSYSIKTVIDSYAYYSYNYKYETVPFKVASYIYTDDLRISNFADLGSYITDISYAIKKSVGGQASYISDFAYNLSEIFTNMLIQDRDIAKTHDNVFTSYNSILNLSIKEFNTNINNSVSLLSYAISDKLVKFTATEEAAIAKLETNVVSQLTDHKNILNTGFINETRTLDKNLGTINETIHNDLVGDGSSKEIETVSTITTYTPVKNRRSGLVSSYTYKTETKSDTIQAGGSSIGEILANTLGTVSEYESTDLHTDGSYTVTTKKGFIGIGEILANLSINKKLPEYKEFMVDIVPRMFSNVDFEADYEVEYDIFGNIKSRKKRNPTDIAKKCIMRADILWNELKKKGIVS